MKFLLIVLLLLTLCNSGLSQGTQLQPGDIAIIGFNFKNPDDFSFITFVNLNAGTVIYFTDCGWKDDNTFRTGEGIVTYTVPSSGKLAFEVITFGLDPGFTTQGVGGFFGFSVDGDQIFAYQGTFAAPQFIFAINNNGTSWQTNSTDNNTSALPTGLTNGVHAVALPESVNSSYNCVLELGSPQNLLTSICNASNWNASNIDRITLPIDCFRDILPVHLISFDVKNELDYNLLSFCTSDENLIRNYILEKSEDGKTFITLEIIQPENTQEIHTYFYKDPEKSNCYYRLCEIDLNGFKKYFSSIYAGRNQETIYGYFIYNGIGELILNKETSIEREEEIIGRAKLFKNGFYIIKIITSTEIKTFKVLNE